MIVVATNNGRQFIEKLIPAFEQYGTGGHRVAFIDTGSTDGSWEWLVHTIHDLHKLDGRDWVVEQTPYRGYDTGAYVYAFKRFPQEETFLFMHDSARPDGHDWVEKFENKVDVEAVKKHYIFSKNAVGPVGAVGITVYSGLFCSPEQPQWLDRIMPFQCADVNAPLGIGGPIFYTTRSVLEIADAYNCFKFFPSRKIEQMAMEGGWGTIMHYLGYQVVSATGYSYNVGTQTIDIVNAALKGFMQKDEPKRN